MLPYIRAKGKDIETCDPYIRVRLDPGRARARLVIFTASAAEV